MPKLDEPAWGERNAITGYYPQYRLSAAMVIRGLREGSLHWIALADPNAGRVDDFQIATDQRIDAYQFKWSRYGGAFTFSDLIRASDASPSLIKQLADGWKLLQEDNPLKGVVVHLVTNQHPSISDQLPVGDPSPAPRHFAAFVEQAWRPSHLAASTSEIRVPAAWLVTWNALRDASGLTGEEFNNFVLDCELDFGRSLPTTEGMSSRDAEIFQKDLDNVTHKIFAAVYDPQYIVRLNREELLSRLGWKDRFEYRNQHSFPVNETLYQPIEDSRKALERALMELDGGYIAVLGTPGSGKSTLLTQTLRYFPQRVVRYYAFIPDAQSGPKRGEAINFLHDVVRALEDTGFRPGQSINYPDREQLRERLREQLQLLHRDWLATGRKTIILVDGLDHIPREQHPMHSLLHDLPTPDQVPQGIYFVLGSQTDQLDDLPSAVQFAIRRPGRRIEMGHLTREAVRHIVQRADLADLLSQEQVDQVYQLSAGHPLALIYLLKQLERASDSRSIELVLRNSSPYSGRIEEQYHGYWRQLDADDELATLLGLIARIRGAIDLKWVESWSPAAVIHRLRRKFAHLFKIEGHDRWYFFHNSFRLYLIDHTAHSTPGIFDPARDRAQHYELAVRCKQSSDARWQWEEIYHLYKAEADDQLLQRARSVFFREQFLAFRSVEAIRSDIVLAILAAGRRRDVVSLVRLLLSDAEMAQREANTERLSLAPLLLSLGEQKAALEYLHDGQRLRVSPESALANSVSLLGHGLEREARQLFDMGEPLEYLSGAKEVDHYDRRKEQDLLKAWASASIYFRTIDKIIGAIQHVRIETDHFARQSEVDDNQQLSLVGVDVDRKNEESKAEAESRFLQDILLFRVGLALIAERRWDDLREIEKTLLERGLDSEEWWFAMRAHCWKDCLAEGDLTRAKQFLDETIAQVNMETAFDERRIIIAESLLRVDDTEQQARSWMQEVQPLRLQKIPDFNFDFSVFDQLFRYARLLYAFGDQRQPAEMIPDPAEPRQQGSVYFQRGVCRIARIWAGSWRGQILDPATVRQESFPLLRLFYHSWRETKWDSWHSLTELKGEFYEMLVDAVALHGTEPLQALAEEFVSEWEGNSRYWSSKAIRQIILALHANGVSEEWASLQLERVESIIAKDQLLERISEEIEQVGAWLRIGKTDVARESLLRALLDSSSVGGKDFQMSEWVAWMQRTNKLDPEGAAKRVAWFAAAVVELERNGGQSSDASYDLLEAVFEWSPRRAVSLFRWFLSRNLIHFDNAVRRLLRAALASSAPPAKFASVFLTEFLLSVSNKDSEIIELLIKRLYEQAGREDTIRFAREFASAVDIRSLPSNRAGWRRSLAKGLQSCNLEISDAGLSEDVLKPVNDPSTDNGLLLKDGSSLTTVEVRTRAASLAGLRELMQQQDGPFYHWDEIIADLSSKLDSPVEVMEVVGYFASRSYSALILGRLSERLLALGDIDNARMIAQKALAASETSGWAVQISGGSKITAFKVLTAIDGEKARQQALARLVEDVTGTYRYSGSIVQNLGEILPSLTASVPEKEVWAEIEAHVHSLFPAVDSGGIDTELQALVSEAPVPDTPVRALADLLSQHVAHPINLLANSAQAAFIGLLLKGDQATKDAIQKLLGSSEHEQECGLMVLDAATARDAGIAAGFADELSRFTSSPNFALRMIAQRICQRIGIILSIVRTGEVIIPSIYILSLPPGPEVMEVWRQTPTTEYEFLPETDDPYELLKIQLLEFQWVASHAGVPAENVIQRAAQIARGLVQEDEWAAVGEKEMRYRFDLAGLKYTYRRPRATIARRAFFHVVAELVDAGLLKPSSLREMKPVFDYYDPEMFFIKSVARPGFVIPVPGGRHRETFIAPPSEAKEEELPKLKTIDGLVIFGEYTKVKRLQWETPTVIRQSVLSIAAPDTTHGRYSFFHGEKFCLIRDYSRLRIRTSHQPLVIWHEGGMFDSPGPEWLAFNPELARAVGWAPDPHLLFGWVDETGQPMVWSIWWEDGLYQSQPPKFDDDVGEGWAVAGSAIALEILTTRMGNSLTQYLRIEKNWLKDGQRRSRVRTAERETATSLIVRCEPAKEEE